MENKNSVTVEFLSLIALAVLFFTLSSFWNWFMVPLAKAISIPPFHFLGIILAVIAISSIGSFSEMLKNHRELMRKNNEEKKESTLCDIAGILIALAIGYVAKILLGM